MQKLFKIGMVMKKKSVVVVICTLVSLSNVTAAHAGKSSGGSSYRSAQSGQYVQKSYATANKATTIHESKPSANKPSYRSAESGKFVDQKYAEKNPSKTVHHAKNPKK
jgi:hypothetical protein